MTGQSKYLHPLGLALICATLSAEAAAAQSYVENFDGVTAPALPADWTVSGSGGGAGWVTSAVQSDSAPNALAIQLAATTSRQSADWPILQSDGSPVNLTFRRRHDSLESDGSSGGCDSVLLQVSVNGGAFVDVVTAGGTFTAGGYMHFQHNVCASAEVPAGQPVWSGIQPSFITTTFTHPGYANGDLIQYRFLAVSDGSFASQPIYIDSIGVTGLSLAPKPVPTLSEWAMILLGAALAGAAALMIQRRRLTG